jgi:hypothetical protein
MGKAPVRSNRKGETCKPGDVREEAETSESAAAAESFAMRSSEVEDPKPKTQNYPVDRLHGPRARTRYLTS